MTKLINNPLYNALLSNCKAVEVDDFFCRTFSVMSPDEIENADLDEDICLDAGDAELSINEILSAEYQKGDKHWLIKKPKGQDIVVKLFDLKPVTPREALTMEDMMSYIGSSQDPKDYLLELLNGEYSAESFYNDVSNHEV